MWHDNRIVKPFWTGYLLSISLCLDLGIVNLAGAACGLTQGGTAAFLRGAGIVPGRSQSTSRWRRWARRPWRSGPHANGACGCFGTGVLLYLAWKMAKEAFIPSRSELGEGSQQSHKSLCC
jgi:L-lysine exporter family protein LysE/ArgO